MILFRKGSKGYGFTIRSVRVYLSETSEYYTIEHIVSAVRPGSPGKVLYAHSFKSDKSRFEISNISNRLLSDLKDCA